MDEGMTKFFETRYFSTKYANRPELQAEKFYRAGRFGKHIGLSTLTLRKSNYLSYLNGARKNSDQSPDLNAAKYSGAAYREDVYRKSALAFDHLLSYLGDSVFDRAMQNYYSQWKFKHPQPEDIKKSFEATTGKNPVSYTHLTMQTSDLV